MGPGAESLRGRNRAYLLLSRRDTEHGIADCDRLKHARVAAGVHGGVGTGTGRPLEVLLDHAGSPLDGDLYELHGLHTAMA